MANSGNNIHNPLALNKVSGCPVARQAHNLKVSGSNPLPDMKHQQTRHRWKAYRTSRTVERVEPPRRADNRASQRHQYIECSLEQKTPASKLGTQSSIFSWLALFSVWAMLFVSVAISRLVGLP